MKLYLSSHGVGNQPERLQSLTPGKRMLFIENAKDDLPHDERAAHVLEKRQEFHDLGFEFEELDLRRYFDGNHDFSPELGKADIVWLAGGNTFILRRALAQSGFDRALTEAVTSRKVAFGGSSAGAIVATPSLHGVEHGDDPDIVPEGYHKEPVWSGLGLVPFHLVPHYKSEFSEEMRFGAQAMIAYFKQQSINFHALRDGDVYLIDGLHQEILK